MPELPEVEGFRAVADRHLVGRTVLRARALDPLLLGGLGPTAFARRLAGRRVTATARRGKVLVAFTDGGPALVLHFGMTGLLLPADPRSPLHPHDRLLVDLDDGTQLRYRNMRRLGFVRLMGRGELSDLMWSLGPDALEVPAGWFTQALRRRRAPVKAVLCDQSFLAGVGNIWADEALHAAGIHPARPASSLSPEEARRLWRELRGRLRRAVREARAGRLPALRLPRRRGEPCPRCGRPLAALSVGGRTAYACPSCQR